MHSYERQVYALAFIPCFKALLAELFDLSICFQFSMLYMMPFRSADSVSAGDRPGASSYFGVLPENEVDRVRYFIICLNTLAALLFELEQLIDCLFEDTGE